MTLDSLKEQTVALGHQTSAVLQLSNARRGKFVVVQLELSGSNELRLSRLGICESRSIELVGEGDPLLLVVGGSLIGLSRVLAQRVLVKELNT